MKAEPKNTVGPAVKLPQPQATSSQAVSLANAVRIEKLSDEENEEVDITDDLSSDGDCNEPPGVRSWHVVADDPDEKRVDARAGGTVDILDHRTPPQSSSPCYFETSCTAGDDENAGGRTPPDRPDVPAALRTNPAENKKLSLQSAAPPQTCSVEEGSTDCTGQDCCLMFEFSWRTTPPLTHVTLLFCFITGFGGEQVVNEKVNDDDEEAEEDDEVLKPPEQEVEMDMESITEDEKQAIPEFFEGRPSKTPDRYLKIRNYILDQWSEVAAGRTLEVKNKGFSD